jgi:DNA-binding NtrC family response regulator
MERPLALVVEQDPTNHALIRDAFEKQQILTRAASSGAEAMEALGRRPVGILVVDADMPGVGVQELLDHASELPSDPVVIAVTSSGDGERAAALIERGAFDILHRPLEASRLRLAVRKAARYREVLDETRRLREDLQSREGYHGIVGRSPAMERLRERLERLAGRETPVWFWGETGTGKELAARTLHQQSRRAGRPFVILSCGGLDASTWRRQLGLDDSGGVFTEANGGTLYLEDLPVLAADRQAALVAKLETLAVGAIDVRLLASSKERPDALADEGRVIDELQVRVAEETMSLPPLRDRIEDIPLLAKHFITTIRAINHLPPIQLAPEALDLLKRHHWPDNVQGLRNAMEQAVILAPDGTIRPRDLPDRLREFVGAQVAPSGDGAAAPRRFRDAKREVVESFERSYLNALMKRHGGNVTAASQRAGMLRSALQRLLRKYGLKSASFRRPRQVAPQAEESTRPDR